jgi:hypothetical protein
MIIKFSDDATDATIAGVIAQGVLEWTVDIDHENPGYPHKQVMILEAGRDPAGEVITICETDDFGAAIPNGTWEVPIEGLRSITVL